MKDLKVSLVQVNLKWEDPQANLSAIESLLKNVDTDLIVLPEMFSTAFTMKAAKNFEEEGGMTTKWMMEMAKSKHAAITGSIIIKSQGAYFNRMLFCYPDGKLSYYNKRHLFRLANEHEVFEAGKERGIVEYLGWQINLNVCYDLRFPVWTRNQNDYELLINVASWPKTRIDHWKTLLKARAIENQVFAIGVNRVGRDQNDYEYSGYSSVYGPSGTCHMELVNDEKLETTILSKKELIDYRAKYPFFTDKDNFKILP